jgi:hypothetical protein
MAATIDNLEAHHRYTVIRGFTDAKGIKVPFEATGVIRRIDLNPQYTEIYIDWEREGPGGQTTAERLTFLMSATDGPRNGKMKDYFERGEVVMPPREPKAPKSTPPAPEPAPVKRPEESLARFEGRQPQEERLLNELTVACDCGPAFHRSIYPPANLSVNACLRCGAVTVTRQVGDDGRFHGNAWTAYWTVPTDQKLVDWLGKFPRVSVDHSGAVWRWPMSASLMRYPTLLYPADTRVADEAELKTLEATLAEAQAPLTRANRLGSACGDIPPTPDNLPDEFRSFAALRHVLDLRPGSDLDALKAHAHLLSSASELAADLLLRRDDAYAVMMDWLASKDDNTFSAGIAMLRDSRPLFSGPDDKRLTRPLLEIMYALPLGKLKDAPDRVESCQRFESFLVAIADLGVNTPEMLESLADLAKKLARKDPYTVDAIRLVINELNGVDNKPAEYRVETSS